jgi:hypothetical protein
MFVLASTLSTAQLDSSRMKHRHELGGNLTAALRTVLEPVGVNSFGNYVLQYRYHFKRSNLRIGVGFSHSRALNTSFISQELSENDLTYTYATLRIGCERLVKLAKHWEAFYGFELRPEYSKQYSSFPDFNVGFTRRNESDLYTAGAAALLGVRFRINSRVSVLTETSYGYFLTVMDTRFKFVPLFPGSATGVTVTDGGARSLLMGSTFTSPVGVVLSIDF